MTSSPIPVHLRRWSWLLILLVVALIYARSLEGELIRPDDIYALAFAYEHGPLGVFVGQDYDDYFFGDRFYRPFFIAQTWLLYQLFGVNYAGYQVTLLLIHALTAVILYLAFATLVNNRWALLLSLLYVSESIISELVLVVSDSAVLLNLSAAVVLLLLTSHQRTRIWFLVLFTSLLLAAFARENGLVLLATTFVYGVGASYLGASSRQDGLRIAAVAVAALGIYLALRLHAFGLLPATVPTGATGLFFHRYSRPEAIQLPVAERLLVSVYTGIANLVAVFFRSSTTTAIRCPVVCWSCCGRLSSRHCLD